MNTRSPARILLTEDDPNVAAALAAAMQLLIVPEPTVIRCASAEAAQALLALQAFDLLIADQCLPYGTGLDLLLDAQNHWPQMPSILMTGYAAADVEAAARRNGIPCLSKPFAVRSLIATVHQLLSFFAHETRHLL